MVVFLILAASLLYLHGFRGLLPYYLDPDEPHFYIAASEIRLTGQVRINPLYPPLRPYLMAAGQVLIDAASGGRPPSTVYAIFARAGSAFAALTMLAVIYQIGRQLHGSLAGLLAAGLVAFDPQAVAFSHVARGDTLSWLFTAGVMVAALRLLKRPTRGLWSLLFLCSIAAILAKYTAAPIGLLPACLILRVALPRPWMRGLALAVTAAAGTGLIWHIRTHPEVWAYALNKTGLFLLAADVNFRNLQASAAAFRSGLSDGWLAVGLAFIPAYLIWGRRRFDAAQRTLFGLLAGVVGGTAAAFTLVAARYHDGYVVALIWGIFGGLALALVAENMKGFGLLAALGLAIGLSAPRAIQAWQNGEQLTQPHSLVTLGDWFIEHVPQGARVVVEQATPFNSYAGFPGPYIYHQVTVDSLFDESLASYQARGYEYAVWYSKSADPPEFFGLDALARQEYFRNARLVLGLTPPDYRKPVIAVFQIPSIQQHPLYAWFTPAISFRGYDLNRDAFKPGDTVELMLYWMSAEKIETNYIVFVHVLDPKTGKLLAGQDGPPDYGNTPTWRWQGDMQFIRDQRIFTLPADAPPGAYTLRVGLYDAGTGQRVQVLDLQKQPEGDGLVLQEIQIEK